MEKTTYHCDLCEQQQVSKYDLFTIEMYIAKTEIPDNRERREIYQLKEVCQGCLELYGLKYSADPLCPKPFEIDTINKKFSVMRLVASMFRR